MTAIVRISAKRWVVVESSAFIGVGYDGETQTVPLFKADSADNIFRSEFEAALWLREKRERAKGAP